MFFEGTLQEGISTALQQSKLVVCFVTDDDTESKQWENEFLADDALKQPLTERAVTLKLQVGSAEAGYLAAIFPLPKTPTLVIIRNGELKEYIAVGVSREDFVSRTRKALEPTPSYISQPSASSQVTTAQTQAVGTLDAESTRASSSDPTSRHVQSLLAERAAKLEAQRKKEAEEAKRLRIEKGKAKAIEGEAIVSGAKPKVLDSQSKHAEALKRKQKDAREERQRILKAIEDDKAARKARQVERQAERNVAATEEETQDEKQAAPSSLWARTSEHCSLQVRLFDGSTLRNRLSSQSRLDPDVRQWVDEHRQDGRQPYIFKVVLTPLPNKTIDVTEESHTLQDLGLTPSSTLILLPAGGGSAAAAAYSGVTRNNPLSRLFLWVMGFLNNFVLFFKTLAGTGLPAPLQETTELRSQSVTTGSDQSRITRLDTTRERRNDQQFYNGNSTNFEPRIDEDED